MAIEVAWLRTEHGTLIQTRTAGGTEWADFGDPLPVPNGTVMPHEFDLHDAYHFVFQEVFGWSEVLAAFFYGDGTYRDAALLREEAGVLNEYIDVRARANVYWCQAMMPEGVCSPEQMEAALARGREVIASLEAQVKQHGSARWTFNIEG